MHCLVSLPAPPSSLAYVLVDAKHGGAHSGGAVHCRQHKPKGPARPARPNFGRKVLKGGLHLCAENCCKRYRPAARYPQTIDSTISIRTIPSSPITRPDRPTPRTGRQRHGSRNSRANSKKVGPQAGPGRPGWFRRSVQSQLLVDGQQVASAEDKGFRPARGDAYVGEPGTGESIGAGRSFALARRSRKNRSSSPRLTNSRRSEVTIIPGYRRIPTNYAI